MPDTQLSSPIPAGYPSPVDLSDDDFNSLYQAFQEESNRRFNISEAPATIAQTARYYAYCFQQVGQPVDLAPLHAAVDAAVPTDGDDPAGTSAQA